MSIPINKPVNQAAKDKPDNLAFNALQECLGAQFAELHTIIQYVCQIFSVREHARSYQALGMNVALEELSHTELICTTIGIIVYDVSAAAPCPKIS